MKALSQKVEQNLIHKIRQQERLAGEEGALVKCDDYINLANLYHMEKDFEQQVKVLERFLNLGLADNADEEIVEAQLADAKSLRHEQRIQKQNQLKLSKQVDPMERVDPRLKLEEKELKPDEKPLKYSREKFQTRTRIITNEIIEEPDIRKLVIMTTGHTGARDDDEIFDIALVSFEYCMNNDSVVKMTGKYHGSRMPNKSIPQEKLSRFGRDRKKLKKAKLDNDLIDKMISEADGVISHQDAYIERQHFVALFPELATTHWYASQLDIPWAALGFKSRALNDLLAQYKISSRFTSLEDRAKGILKLLSQIEPDTNQTLFARLLHCQPMKPVQWTETLKQQSAKLAKKSFSIPFLR